MIIAGGGKLAMQYLARIREVDGTRPIVIVETRPDRHHLDEARDLYEAHIIIGDIRSDVLLAGLGLERASRVLLLTGDDFANLDTAAKILQLAPNLGQRVVAHVSDIHFMRVVEQTHVADEVMIFNTHQIAAQNLVETKLLPHFHKTEQIDTVVIAGFGRFGQTVLDELQHAAHGSFDRVVLVDLECRRRALMFEEQVGFVDGYRRELIDGDVSDPAIWVDLDETCALRAAEPAFVVGSGDDGTNLRTALWLKSKYPSAFVVARSFRRSAFAGEVSRKGGIEVFSVAELMSQSIPDHWVA